MKTGCGLMRGFVPGKTGWRSWEAKSVREEEELGWSHLTLTPTLDFGSQRLFLIFLPLVLGVSYIVTILGSCGFLATLVMMKQRSNGVVDAGWP